MKVSVTSLLCRLDLTVGTAVTQLENINTMGIVRLLVARVRQQHSITRGMVGIDTIKGSRDNTAAII